MAEYVADPPLSKIASLTPDGYVRGKIRIWVKYMSKVWKIIHFSSFTWLINNAHGAQIVINNNFIRK